MLNTIKRTTKNKSAKLVGRGGKRGKTAGRGTKGQKARAGHKIRPVLRDAIKKLPKLRGRGKNSNKAFQIIPTAVNVSQLDKAFNANESVTPSVLLAKGLVRRVNGKMPAIKVLASGEITKSLELYDLQASDAAIEKIRAAGGKVHQ
jgi:large subunit ribosomal protein L15